MDQAEKLPSGDEWSKLPCTDESSTLNSPPDHTHSEGTAPPSGNVRLNSKAKIDWPESNTAVPEEEAIYEDIDLSISVKKQQKKQDPLTVIPHMS